MNESARWRQVQDYFEKTVDLSPAERMSILQSELPDDPDLRREIDSLVVASKTTPRFLDFPASQLVPKAAPEEAMEEATLVGARAGIYQIGERLAVGGMGDVYAADSPHGEVVVKVLKKGLDTERFLRRFRKEQETLSRLDHPNIVTYLDAGVLEDGRPYLVMERVHGTSLTAFARTDSLDTRARVRLFVGVCKAVEYAHQNLVVHRDLKPSNILVTGEGVPMLLDFGVAKLLGLDSPEDGETQTVWPAPLTPAYASPEQLAGGRISTVSDVYSLGAILHELLVGHVPGNQHGPDDIAPSGALRGDLLTIVHTAQRAEPARRYPSVSALRGDLESTLLGRPIAARADSLGYRVSKLAERYRTVTVATLLLVLGLVVGAGGAEWQRRRATAHASRGWGAHTQVKAALSWLEGVAMDASVPDDERRLVLQHAEEDLERLAGLPEAEGLARISLGKLWNELPDWSAAKRHLSRAVELASTTRELGDWETARAHFELGRALRGLEREEAFAHFEKADLLFESRWGLRRAEAVHARIARIEGLLEQGAVQEAARLCEGFEQADPSLRSSFAAEIQGLERAVEAAGAARSTSR